MPDLDLAVLVGERPLHPLRYITLPNVLEFCLLPKARDHSSTTAMSRLLNSCREQPRLAYHSSPSPSALTAGMIEENGSPTAC